jgi:hypothetical protein
MEIFDSMAEIYHREGPIPPADILERLEGEGARERFREAMLRPPICQDSEVEQALKEFEDRVHRIRISESKKRAIKEGDVAGLSEIPKQIKERWG